MEISENHNIMEPTDGGPDKKKRRLTPSYNIESMSYEIYSMKMLSSLMERLKNDKDLKNQVDAAETVNRMISNGVLKQKSLILESAQSFINLLSSQTEKIRELALNTLTKLIDDYAMIVQIVEMNITESTLALVKSETSIEILRKVAHLLKCIYWGASEKLSNANIGEIFYALCILIKHTEVDILTDTVSIIRTIAKNCRDCNENKQFFINTEILVDLVPMLSHEDKKIHEIVLRSVFKITILSDEHTRAVIAQNPLPHFPMLLTHQTTCIRWNALWCLLVIIDRSPSQVQVVIDLGLMPIVIGNLRHEDFMVQKFAARIVAIISKRGTEDQIKELFCSDVIIERFFGELLNCDFIAVKGLLEGLTNILKIYCTNMPSLKSFKHSLPIVTKLMSHFHYGIRCSAVVLMSIFTDGREDRIQLLIDNRILPILISFLSRTIFTKEKLLKASLCLIGDIVSGSDSQIDFVLNSKLLSKFPELLRHSDADIVDKSLFILSKINETANRTKLITNAGLLELIIEKFKHDEFRIKKKSSFVISNMTLNASKEQITGLLNAGAIHSFLNMAKYHDAETNHIVLNGMMNIMTTYHNEPPMPTEISEQISLTLQHLIYQTDDNILERSAWALSYFLDGGDELIQPVIDSGLVSRLIELLENLEESIKIATLHILCKIVSYATEHQLNLDFNVSSNLSPLLIHPLDEIREVSLTILSNMTCGTQAKAYVIDEVLLSKTL